MRRARQTFGRCKNENLLKNKYIKVSTFLKIPATVCFCFLISCVSPKAYFDIESSEDTVPVRLQMRNMSEHADSCVWDFGNGEKSTELNPEVRYLYSGTYNITLKATKGKKESLHEYKIYLNAPERCLVYLETNYGDLTFELYNETPKHRDNFLRLIHENYYNGIRFHRIIRGFVVQAGDEKTKTHTGSSNYRKEYTIASEINDDFYHTRGALAMARQPDQVNPEKKSSGTQFYIVHGAPVMSSTLEDYEIEKDMEYPEDIKKMYKNQGGSPQLDKEYTIFGHLIDGFDVLDKIAQVSTDSQDKPKEVVEIIRVTEIR